jgi:hypothetical protein
MSVFDSKKLESGDDLCVFANPPNNSNHPTTIAILTIVDPSLQDTWKAVRYTETLSIIPTGWRWANVERSRRPRQSLKVRRRARIRPKSLAEVETWLKRMAEVRLLDPKELDNHLQWIKKTLNLFEIQL